MEATNFFVNIDKPFPLACNSVLKLYKSTLFDNRFIYQCGNTYYEYTFHCVPEEQEDNEYRKSSYTLKDVLDAFAFFDAYQLKKVLPTLELKWCYEQCSDLYIGAFVGEYKHTLSYMRNIIDTCFKNRIQPWFCYEGGTMLYYSNFMEVIKTVYFLDDASRAIHKYRHGVCEISVCSDNFLKSCYEIVAENKLDKKLFKFLDEQEIYCEGGYEENFEQFLELKPLPSSFE